MGVGVASWSLHVLLIVGIQLFEVSSASRYTHDEFKMFSSIFYSMKELKKGTTKPIYLPKKDPSGSPFWPRDEAESIPFSSSRIPETLAAFGAPPGSALAATIEHTIVECEQPAMEGETRRCVTSLESMLDFVSGVFGGAQPTLVATRFVSEHREEYQNYTIMERPEEVRARNMVGCHSRPYPHGVFLCHTQVGGTRIYKTRMIGHNGDLAEVCIACHLDTRHWDPSTPALVALGTRPGTPACHVFGPGNLVWAQNYYEASSAAI